MFIFVLYVELLCFSFVFSFLGVDLSGDRSFFLCVCPFLFLFFGLSLCLTFAFFLSFVLNYLYVSCFLWCVLLY